MTKYIKEEEIQNTTLFEICNAIRKGKIIVFKTDTVYGLGTSVFDETACQRIYEIKGRDKQKPLCVLISDMSMLKQMVNCISPAEKIDGCILAWTLNNKIKKKEKCFTGYDFCRG